MGCCFAKGENQADQEEQDDRPLKNRLTDKPKAPTGTQRSPNLKKKTKTPEEVNLFKPGPRDVRIVATEDGKL